MKLEDLETKLGIANLGEEEKLALVKDIQANLPALKAEQRVLEAKTQANLVVEAIKKIKEGLEARFDELNGIVDVKVRDITSGKDGKDGKDGKNGVDGKDGKDGISITGPKGADGKDGEDGVGVQDAHIDFDGSLIITLTTGKELNVGEVVPMDVAEKIKVIGNGGGTSQSVLDAIAAINTTLATYGTMATQNANNVVITGGNINNVTIGGTTPAAGTFTTLNSNGLTILGGVSGNESLRITNVASAVDRIGIYGSQYQAPSVRAEGTNGAVELQFSSKGSGAIGFFTDTLATQQFRLTHTSSAVNYVQVTGAATGSHPTISSQGSDSNARLILNAKGSSSGIDLLMNNSRQMFIGTNGSAVNYFQTGGTASGIGLSLSAQGSDSNISQVFQSKGTGAIDLAAGSSGVNISNGGTVTAITQTNAGGSYTSLPSVSITAPTTAGGVQAVLQTVMGASGVPTITSGGTGYSVNDAINVVGGTGGAAQYKVLTVSSGVITSISSNYDGAYTALPTSPASVTGGTGSGATLTFNAFYCRTPNITNAGSGYVEQPTVSFSGGGGSGAAAYASVGTTAVVKGIYGNNGTSINFQTPSGSVLLLNDATSGTPQAVTIRNASTPQIYPSGTNTTLQLSSAGTGGVSFYTNTNSSQQFNISHTASAVNYVQVTGAPTGNDSTISAQGSDANTGLIFLSKGSTGLTFRTRGGGTARNALVLVDNGSSSVNYLQIQSNLSTTAPSLSAQGSDTDIPLVLQPKGTGALQAQQTDSTATGGNARGANAVDWQTARGGPTNIASGASSVISGGFSNTSSAQNGVVSGGAYNVASNYNTTVSGGQANAASQRYAGILSGYGNSATGYFNIIAGGYGNSGTLNGTVTTQATTTVTSGSTAVTLSGSNANIKVGQLVTGTGIVSFPDTYVAAISGTSLTLSQNASGSGSPTLNFYTPHGVVVGGGNNQATGSYSFIGGGGDAGTAANRNVASGDWSFVGGGIKNTASGIGAFVGGGGTYGSSIGGNTASGTCSAVVGGFGGTSSGQYSTVASGYNNTSNGGNSFVASGSYGTTRGLTGSTTLTSCDNPIGTGVSGTSQTAILVIARQTTDATPTVLASNTAAAGSTNQVILPNNSAYYFRGTVVAGVTGGGNTKGWYIEGVIKRGSGVGTTALVGTPTVISSYADVGAATWALTATADTTNGGLAITFTGQASTTIRCVAKIETTECTY